MRFGRGFGCFDFDFGVGSGFGDFDFDFGVGSRFGCFDFDFYLGRRRIDHVCWQFRSFVLAFGAFVVRFGGFSSEGLTCLRAVQRVERRNVRGLSLAPLLAGSARVVLEFTDLGRGLVFRLGGLVDPSLLAFELVLCDEARVEENQCVASVVVELDGPRQLGRRLWSCRDPWTATIVHRAIMAPRGGWHQRRSVKGELVELWELVARESIRVLVARYNSNGDSARFDAVLELFAPDAVMELPDGVYDGIDQIKTIFTGTKGRLADFGLGTGKQFYMRHYTATHQVDLLDQTHAKGRCYYQVIMAHGLDHWGRYIDEYELREGRWLFTNRKVSMDGYVAGGFGAASDV